jgi:hypothetical protein
MGLIVDLIAGLLLLLLIGFLVLLLVMRNLDSASESGHDVAYETDMHDHPGGDDESPFASNDPFLAESEFALTHVMTGANIEEFFQDPNKVNLFWSRILARCTFHDHRSRH